MLLKKTVFVCVNYRDVFYNIFANNSILLSKRLMQRTFRSLCFKIRDMRTKKSVWVNFGGTQLPGKITIYT